MHPRERFTETSRPSEDDVKPLYDKDGKLVRPEEDRFLEVLAEQAGFEYVDERKEASE